MANTVRTNWEDRYLLAYGDNTITQVGDFSVTGLGIPAAVGVLGVDLNDHPSLSPGYERTAMDKANGLAEAKTTDYTEGRTSPSVNLTMGLTEEKLIGFSWLLFQQGTLQGTTLLNVAMVPPVTGESAMDIYCSIARGMGNYITDTENQALHGVMCSSLGLTFTAGERVTMTADMLAQLHVTTLDLSGATSAIAAQEATTDTLMYDYTFTLGGDDISDHLESCDFTVTNNASQRHYGQLFPSNIIMGKMNTTGNFKIAMSADSAGAGDNNLYDEVVSGAITVFNIAKGTTDTAGYTSISLNTIYTGAEVDPAEELMLDIPFECARDGSNGSISMAVCDGKDWLTKGMSAT